MALGDLPHQRRQVEVSTSMCSAPTRGARSKMSSTSPRTTDRCGGITSTYWRCFIRQRPGVPLESSWQSVTSEPSGLRRSWLIRRSRRSCEGRSRPLLRAARHAPPETGRRAPRLRPRVACGAPAHGKCRALASTSTMTAVRGAARRIQIAARRDADMRWGRTSGEKSSSGCGTKAAPSTGATVGKESHESRVTRRSRRGLRRAARTIGLDRHDPS